MLFCESQPINIQCNEVSFTSIRVLSAKSNCNFDKALSFIKKFMITETDISVQVLPSVTKVLLGCDGVMANGCVLATVGTSQVIN